MISLPISGLLCEYGFAGGWPSVFYVFGVCGIVWFVVWMVFVYDTPAQHPRISPAERALIERSIGHDSSEVRNLNILIDSFMTSSCYFKSSLVETCHSVEGHLHVDARVRDHRGTLLQQLGFLHTPHNSSNIHEECSTVRHFASNLSAPSSNQKDM